MNGSVVTANTAGMESRANIDVGRLDRHEDREHRRRQPPPALAHHERGAAVAVGHGHDAAEEPQDGVLLRVHGVSARPDEADPRHDQQHAQQVDEPVGRLERRDPHPDEDRAEHDRAQDPPEQQAVLVRRRHREGGEDQGEHEDVVDRERQLDQVAREVLAGRLAPQGRRDEDAEAERERDPDGAPRGGRRNGTGFASRLRTRRSRASMPPTITNRTTHGPSVPDMASPPAAAAEGLSRPWAARSAAAGHLEGGRDGAADRQGYSPSSA